MTPAQRENPELATSKSKGEASFVNTEGAFLFYKKKGGNMMHVYGDGALLRRKILEDYRSGDIELSRAHFDIPVCMPEKDLLQLYADIMRSVNGDKVVRINDAQRSGDMLIGEESEIGGSIRLHRGLFSEVIEGQVDLYRLIDWKYVDGKICGNAVDLLL